MGETKPPILSVDDEPHILQLIRDVLEPGGYEVITATDGSQALALVSEKNPEVVLLDIKMPGKSGMEVLKELRMNHSDIAVIMASGVGEIKTAIEAMKMGAFDYLVKPFDVDEIIISVERAREKRRLLLENRQYRLSLERQLTALNKLFQTHMALREETEKVYGRLTSRLAKLSEELDDLLR